MATGTGDVGASPVPSVEALRAIVARKGGNFIHPAELALTIAERDRRTLLALVAALREALRDARRFVGAVEARRNDELLALCDAAGITQGERRG